MKMKYQKIISLAVVMTLIMALFAVTADAALIVDNNSASKTGSTLVEAADKNFGWVTPRGKFGMSIYDMHLTGKAYKDPTASGGPYRMFVSVDFDSITVESLKDNYFVATTYIALDESNYANAVSTSDNAPGIHIGLMSSSKTWAVSRTQMKLDAFVRGNYIHTDRLAKMDVVVTPCATDSSKVTFTFYFNNKKNGSTDIKPGKTSFQEFVISLQAPYSYSGNAINIYASRPTYKLVPASEGYKPVTGTGKLTSAGALAEYAPTFTPGANFYVPEATTIADILEMQSTYKAFELRDDDGNVITDTTSTESAIGYYLYAVGNGNNSEDKGLFSKIVVAPETALVKDAEAKTFTASGVTNGYAGTLIVAKYNAADNSLEDVLHIEDISAVGYYEKTYTVEEYDSASVYKAFYWQKSSLTPVTVSAEF